MLFEPQYPSISKLELCTLIESLMIDLYSYSSYVQFQPVGLVGLIYLNIQTSLAVRESKSTNPLRHLNSI